MCKHKKFKTTEQGFSGPVGPHRRQNRLAHGGVCYRDVCLTCGSERLTNVNGCSSERSGWGPSGEVREAAEAAEAAASVAAAAKRKADTLRSAAEREAEALEAEARRLLAAVPTMRAPDGHWAKLDEKGNFISSVGAPVAALPIEFFEVAEVAVRAVLAAEAARARV